MAEPISIRIDANTTGLDAITRKMQEFQRNLGPPVAGTGGQAQYNVALNLLPGRTEGLNALSQQIARQVSLGVAQGLASGTNTGLRQAQMLGFVPGPGGSVVRAGYAGGLPPTGVQPPPLLPPAVRPGGLRPWPANLPPSPFGPAAGG